MAEGQLVVEGSYASVVLAQMADAALRWGLGLMVLCWWVIE